MIASVTYERNEKGVTGARCSCGWRADVDLVRGFENASRNGFDTRVRRHEVAHEKEKAK